MNFNFAYKLVIILNKFLPTQSIPVLMYHSVSKTPSKLSVSPENFDIQLKILAKSGYQSLSLAQFEAYYNQRKIPPKSVLITFDDGLEDNYTLAAPLLRKYNFIATFFINGKYIGSQASHLFVAEDRYKKIMSPEQLKKLSTQNFDIANHFYSHQPLISLSPAQIKSEYEQNAKFLKQSISPKTKTDFVAYPKNKTNPDVTGHLRFLGVKFGFSGHNIPAKLTNHRLNIPRIAIFNADNKLKFQAKLSPYYHMFKYLRQ